MSFLKNLFGGRKTEVVEVAPAAECLHVTLAPKWDSVADMGDESKATSFTCDACHMSFTPAATRALRGSEGERLKEVIPAEPGEGPPA